MSGQQLEPVGIGVLGAGYVADMYAATLAAHPDLALVGAFDINQERKEIFARKHHCEAYGSFDDLLKDQRIELVLNLTNPRSHLETTSRCLNSGKHVYSEKPLAMNSSQAWEMVELAKKVERLLASAPCSLQSDGAQNLWRVLNDGLIGKVRLIYANFEDGLIAPNQTPWEWTNELGIAWPAKDEFEIGCTYEHAGYLVTWLVAFFGPAKSVTSFASCQVLDKGIPVDSMAPDFVTGCIEFAEGIVARVCCGLVAPRDKSIEIIGDRGILAIQNVRNDQASVFLYEYKEKNIIRRLINKFPGLERMINRYSRIPLDRMVGWKRLKVPNARRSLVAANKPVDFLIGPSQMVSAIRGQAPLYQSSEYASHVLEIVEALQHPERFNGKRIIVSSFAKMFPLPSPNIAAKSRE